MKTISQAVSIGLGALALWVVVPRVVADQGRFYRMAGPAPTVITGLTPEG